MGKLGPKVNKAFVGVRVLALGQAFVVKLLPVFGPGFHVDVGHLGAFGRDQGRVEHDRFAGGVADRISQSVFDDEAGDPVVDLDAVPSEIGKNDRLFRLGGHGRSAGQGDQKQHGYQ